MAAGNEVQLNLSLADHLSQLRGNTIGEKRKADEIDDGCNNNDNCFDHLIGSAAEVGHLWSIARYILTTSHTSNCNESKIVLINQFSNVPDIILSTSYQDSPFVFHSLRVHYFLGRWNPHIVVVCHAGLNARDVFPKPRQLRSGA